MLVIILKDVYLFDQSDYLVCVLGVVLRVFVC